MMEGPNNGENEPDGEDDRETAVGETPAGDAHPRPSLAERLMSLDPSRGDAPRSTPARSAPATTHGAAPRPADVPPAYVTQPPSERSSLPPVERHAWAGSVARFSPVMAEDALTEARRFIRFKYFAFLASVLVVFVFTVVVGVAFIEALLSDEEWERLGINGGVVAVSVALLVLLVYRPGRSLALAASQLAQLEAARAHLNKSYEFWERYLVERQEAQQLTANDVALAVSSLTAASREMTDSLVDETASNKSGPTNEVRAGRLPTDAMPDPRRY